MRIEDACRGGVTALRSHGNELLTAGVLMARSATQSLGIQLFQTERNGRIQIKAYRELRECARKAEPPHGCYHRYQVSHCALSPSRKVAVDQALRPQARQSNMRTFGMVSTSRSRYRDVMKLREST